MKIFILLFLFTATSMAHMKLFFPTPRDLNDNCIAGPLNEGKNTGECKKREKNFPCGGSLPNPNIVTTLKAGQILNVSFLNPEFEDSVFFSKEQNRFLVNKEFFEKNHKNDNQGRHNGGTCEFALSYDGGKSFVVIATYHESCPDMSYDWPVKIPINAPSCKNGANGKSLGDCIFSWSWLSSITQEFYQNCADIEIISTSADQLIGNDITKVNLPGVFDKIVNIPGEKPKCCSDADEDGPPGGGKACCNARGKGPKPEDIDTNLK